MTRNHLKIREIYSIISICRDSGLQSYKYTIGWSRGKVLNADNKIIHDSLRISQFIH